MRDVKSRQELFIDDNAVLGILTKAYLNARLPRYYTQVLKHAFTVTGEHSQHLLCVASQITVYPGGSLNHPIRNPDTGGFNKLINHHQVLTTAKHLDFFAMPKNSIRTALSSFLILILVGFSTSQPEPRSDVLSTGPPHLNFSLGLGEPFLSEIGYKINSIFG
ncbi:hypothetical protein PGT21_003783 [Puccinia graminis f. sp. tritici]|uniref:Uncharacterized protein n=1 Tax=Puccinia graminis f. sp. tritici TaxID=56615 RepID=A0A5B0LTJ2_PUCGR|nr:hypothetical protein PGT21_003783 [Puccinia graminis f. sp. tritici]